MSQTIPYPEHRWEPEDKPDIQQGAMTSSHTMTAGEMTLYDEFMKNRKPVGFAPEVKK